MSANVFISYASPDHALADLVQLKLAEAGHDVWRDVASLRPGDRWPTAIDQALLRCDVLLMILTPEATSSAFVTYEWMMATRMREDSDSQALFLPLLFKPCEPHPKILEVQFLDFTKPGKPWGALLAEIAIIGTGSEPSGLEELGQDTPLQTKARAEGWAGQADAAVEQILQDLKGSGYTRISFERLATKYGYQRDFVEWLIEARPGLFRRAKLRRHGSTTYLDGIRRL